MLLYTVVPEEFIFELETQKPDAAPEVEIKMGTVTLLGQSLPNGQFRINRIISSDSRDYLNPHWQPGMVL